MEKMHHITSVRCTCSHCLRSTSAALFELRDALLELSLALQDWQFETDHVQRQEAEVKVRQLLKKAASGQDLDSC